ncbi:hypothetical protein EON63_16580, partial [archaeon]
PYTIHHTPYTIYHTPYTIHHRNRSEFLESVQRLQAMGYQLAATQGTAQYYATRGVGEVKALRKPSNWGEEGEGEPKESVLDYIKTRQIDLVINIPEGTTRKDEVKLHMCMSMCMSIYVMYAYLYVYTHIHVLSTHSCQAQVTAGYTMRRATVDYGVSLLTNIKCAVLFVEALHRNRALPCKSAEEFVGSAVAVTGW